MPVISGAKLIRALERLGWEVVRQRGSHVRLRHPEHRTFLVVPLHRELKRGTLRASSATLASTSTSSATSSDTSRAPANDHAEGRRRRAHNVPLATEPLPIARSIHR